MQFSNLVIILLNFLIISNSYCQKDSLTRFYTNDGILYLEGVYHWVDNFEFNAYRIGVWKEYDDSLGYLKITKTYKRGRLDGNYYEFYPDGRLQVKGQFDYKHSYKIIKLEDGTKVTEFHPYGIWIWYRPDGSIEAKKKYLKNGKEVDLMKK